MTPQERATLLVELRRLWHEYDSPIELTNFCNRLDVRRILEALNPELRTPQ